MLSLLFCLLAIGISATAMKYYMDVEITLVDGTVTTGYCKIDTSNKRLLRDNIYTTSDDSSEKIAWANIKIFDASKGTVVGGIDPVALGGTNCNSQAVNTTEFYLPHTATTVLNSSFTSGWKSLKKVWLPNTVTKIENTSFSGAPLEEIVLEEGTVIKTIEASAFQNCANLSSFPFMEGLESIGRNGFYQSGLSGTVRIPNSVTTLSPGALLSTKIENLYLGAGSLNIGYNFVGTFEATDNAYLKNVYISAEATFDGGGNYFFKCANRVNFYIVGSEAECAGLVQTLKAQVGGKYLSFVEAKDATEDMQAGYGVIYTGYNECVAFYGSQHETLDPVYNFVGYTENAFISSGCERCKESATLCEFAPMIEIIGYSAKIGGNKICIGYKLNEESVLEYNKATGNEISFGVVAIMPINEDELKPLYVENGAVKAIDYTIFASFTTLHASVDFVINGFTEEYYESDLVMCAYAFDGEKITYICDTEGDTATAFKYSDKVND